MKLSPRFCGSLFQCAVIIAGLGAAGCSTKTPAIGNWQGQGKETVEFRGDGTVLGTDKCGRSLTGRFEVVDADHLKFKMTTSSVDQQTGIKSVDNAEGICGLVVQGDQLTLTEEDGTATHYRRAK